MSKTKDSLLHDLYTQWCKETKRGGAILIGGSIREFFDWLKSEGYVLEKHYKKQKKKFKVGDMATVWAYKLNHMSWSGKDVQIVEVGEGLYRCRDEQGLLPMFEHDELRLKEMQVCEHVWKRVPNGINGAWQTICYRCMMHKPL